MDSGRDRIDELTARLELLERRMADETAAIRSELHELRGEPRTRVREPFPAPRPHTGPAAQPPRAEPLDLSWLDAPRALALAGGVVTLLGIVFVFALAANRGWIGPAARCGIGGVVSVLLVAAALGVRHRYGQYIAALVAAGAGIGGEYVTLYASSRGYHLIGTAAVWIAVVAVAVEAVVLALAWSSQTLATLGLVAVVVAPPAVQHHLSAVGLGSSAVAAAAALGLGRWRRWLVLAGVAFGAMLVQTAAYIGDTRHDGTWMHRGTAGAVACVVFALALAGAGAYQYGRDELDPFAAGLASVSLPLGLLAIYVLLHGGDARGGALFGLAFVYGVSTAAAWRRIRTLAEIAAAFALLAVALATAAVISDGGLAAAWTFEGIAAIALAVRLGRAPYQAAGVAYLVAAGVHVLGFETPPDHLFSEQRHPAAHIGWLLLLVAALAAVALLLRGREQLFDGLDLLAGAVAALLALYAASLAVMAASEQLGSASLHTRFQRGETFVSALWALVALGLLAAGLLRRIPEVRYAGLGLLGLALAKLFLFDLSQLSSLARAGSFLAVGLALLAGGFLVQRLAARPGARAR